VDALRIHRPSPLLPPDAGTAASAPGAAPRGPEQDMP
jgi:hypothetical protein